MTKRERESPKRRFSQKTADFRGFTPEILEIPAFGGRRKPQKTGAFRREPKLFAESRRKPPIGLRHLRCVTFSSSYFFRLQPDGRNARGETRLRGPEVSGPLEGLEFDPSFQQFGVSETASQGPLKSPGKTLRGPGAAPQRPRRGVSVFDRAGKEGGPLRGL